MGGTDEVPFHLPIRGEITAFDAADAIGKIALENGVELRFGSSACRGFPPVLGAWVEVHAVGAHPLGGHRATEVVVPESQQGRLDDVLDRRSEVTGAPRTGSDASETVSLLATVSLLLQRRLSSRRDVRGLLEESGALEEARLVWDVEPELHSAGDTWHLYVGDGPFIGGREEETCGPHFYRGRSLLGISANTRAMNPALLRAITANPSDRLAVSPDPWREGSSLRRLTVLVARLLREDGVAVVLHHADDLIIPASEWLERIGDPMDPDCRPMDSWMDVVAADGGERVITAGLHMAGFPELFVRLDPDADEAEVGRAEDALWFGAERMTREARLLDPGGVLQVPEDFNPGPWPPREPVDADGATFAFAIGRGSGLVELTPLGKSAG